LNRADAFAQSFMAPAQLLVSLIGSLICQMLAPVSRRQALLDRVDPPGEPYRVQGCENPHKLAQETYLNLIRGAGIRVAERRFG
jgi:hypothetical protein